MRHFLTHLTVFAVLLMFVAGCGLGNRPMGEPRTGSSLAQTEPTRTEAMRTGMTHPNPVWAAADNPICVLIPTIDGVELKVYDDYTHPAEVQRTDMRRTATGDPALSAAVKERLVEERIADSRDVHVEADRERVYLDGTVDTPEQKRRAGEIAQRVTGASIVENHLRVQSAGMSRSEGVRRVDDRGNAIEPIWTGKLMPGQRYEIRSDHGLIRYDYRLIPNDRFHGDVGAWCNRGHEVIVP